MKDTNSVAAMVAADRDRLDFVAADNQMMLKNNTVRKGQKASMDIGVKTEDQQKISGRTY